MMRATPPGPIGSRVGQTVDHSATTAPGAVPSTAAGDAPMTPAGTAGHQPPPQKTALQVEMLKMLYSANKRKAPGASESAHAMQVPDDSPRLKRQKCIADKAGPYWARSGVPGVDLNCMVPVSPRADDPAASSEVVVCRHFSYEFATQGGKKGSLPEVFSRVDGVQERFSGRLRDIDKRLDAAIREAPQACKHAIGSDQFGQYLLSLAQALDQSRGSVAGPSHANCLLLTSAHVLALHMERKQKDGERYFSIKLYDPNETATYQRAERPNAEGFAGLSLEDFLGKEDVQFYAHGAQGPLLMVALCLDSAVQPEMPRTLHVTLAEHMYMALTCELHHDFDMILDAVTANPGVDSLFDVLQAKPAAHQSPGLAVALEFGMKGAVRQFADYVLNSEALTQDQVFELMQANRSNGSPALFTPLWYGKAAATFDYVSAISETRALSGEQKLSLLQASSLGLPALYSALERGVTESVKTYVDAVLSAKGLNSDEKTRLLSATPEFEGAFPGLYIAFRENYWETVQAFVLSVLNADDLSEQQKLHLLRAEGETWKSGLAVARYIGYPQSVDVFTRCVWQTTRLSEEAKQQLLA